MIPTKWMWIAAVQVAVVGAAFTTRSYGVAGVLALFPFISLFVKKYPLDRIGQIIVGLITGASVYSYYFVINTPGDTLPAGVLGPVASTVVLTLLAIAIGRLFMDQPIWGVRGTAGILFGGILFMGVARFDMVYSIIAWCGIGCVLLALKSDEGHRPPFSQLKGKRKLLTVIALATTGVITLSIYFGLPILYKRAIDNYYNALVDDQMGFSGFLSLGSLKNMFQSNEVVLRIDPGKVDFIKQNHLRGIVYNRYSKGSWYRLRDNPEISVRTSPLQDKGNNLVEIIAVGGNRKNYFVPLWAGAIHAEEHDVIVDTVGIISPPVGEQTERMWLVPGRSYSFPLLKPVDEDLYVPEKLELELASIAGNWTLGTTNDWERIQDILTTLKKNYRYSLDFKRSKGMDPILGFLTNNRQGHCEYFASALALLLRTLDIPTRVVGGYLVSEYNPLGDYYIVRERNAHTWVEVWIETEGWVTVDPTPPSGLESQMSNRPSALAALGDWIRHVVSMGLDKVSKLETVHVVLIVFGLVFVWIGIRLVRRLRIRHTNHLEIIVGYKDPEVCFNELVDGLSSRGIVRQTNETVEQFALRVSTSERGGLEAAALLSRYAAWRYGDQGDIGTLGDDIQKWISSMS